LQYSSSRFLLIFLRLLWVCGQRVCVVQAKRHIHSLTRSAGAFYAFAPHGHRRLVVDRLVRATVMPAFSSLPVNAALVNCAPWSVLLGAAESENVTRVYHDENIFGGVTASSYRIG
jgi:hypothetical protein